MIKHILVAIALLCSAPAAQAMPLQNMEDYLLHMATTIDDGKSKAVYTTALEALQRGETDHPAFVAAMNELKQQNSIRRVLLDLESITAAYSLFALETRTDTQNITDLIVDPHLAGWNGPYVEQQAPLGGEFGLYDIFFAPFTPAGVPSPMACIEGMPCLVWLRLTDVPTWVSEEVELMLDTRAGVSGDTGLWRYGPVRNGLQDGYYTLAEVLNR